MNDEDEVLARAVGELTRDERRRQGPEAHPAPQTLTSYHAGELTPAAESDLQEHLAVCPHCSCLLLDLPSFLEPPEFVAPSVALLAGAGTYASGPAEPGWPELRKHLPGLGGEDRAGPSPGPRLVEAMERDQERRSRAFVPRPGYRRALQLLAASLLVALIAVPLWRIARRPAAADLAPTLAELYPAENTRGSGDLSGNSQAAPPTTLRTDLAAVLVLHLAREQPNLRFRLEVQPAAGPSAALPGATPLDASKLLLVLPPRKLQPGLYRLRVLDPEQPSAEPLGDYPLRVVEP